MLLSPSQGILEVRPELPGRLRELARLCQRADRDLRTKHLRVEVRRHPRSTRFQGYAYAEMYSVVRGDVHFHANGRVQLVVGDRVRDSDIVRLACHEFRHIAQFHRGKARHHAQGARFASLNCEHMTDPECEDDAYLFEYTMLDRLGIVYP